MPAPRGQRSANFTAAASLILITAYAEMTATRLPEQAKGVDEAKMADIFFSNCRQDDSGRSVSSLAQRFKTMTRSYRYVHTAILHTRILTVGSSRTGWLVVSEDLLAMNHGGNFLH